MYSVRQCLQEVGPTPLGSYIITPGGILHQHRINILHRFYFISAEILIHVSILGSSPGVGGAHLVWALGAAEEDINCHLRGWR